MGIEVNICGFSINVANVYALNGAGETTSCWKELKRKTCNQNWILNGDWNMTKRLEHRNHGRRSIVAPEREAGNVLTVALCLMDFID